MTLAKVEVGSGQQTWARGALGNEARANAPTVQRQTLQLTYLPMGPGLTD
jgi:hypothetical protein